MGTAYSGTRMDNIQQLMDYYCAAYSVHIWKRGKAAVVYIVEYACLTLSLTITLTLTLTLSIVLSLSLILQLYKPMPI